MELFLRHCKQNITLILAAAGLLTLLSLSTPVYAQCIWEDWNCTPTPGTPTPTGTRTATVAATVQFAPLQFGVPTSIPAVSLPTALPAAQFTPIPAPSPLAIELTPIATAHFDDLSITPEAASTITAISSTLNLSYTLPLTANLQAGTSGISTTDDLSGTVGGWLPGAISYTNFLTGEVAAIQGSETITVISAPDWYAPGMPRPFADVGWTFETLTDPAGDTKNFTMTSWSSFFGYVVSLPFQLIKSLWQLVAYFGPFGLFLGWLLIMFVIVLVIQFWAFLVRFILLIVRIVTRILELLGEWIPTGG